MNNALAVDAGVRRRLELTALGQAIRPLATDLGSSLSFYLLFAATGSLVAATLSGLALGLVQLGWMRWRRRRIAAMQWAMLLLVGVVGGLTLLLRDPRIAFYQVSIVYLIVGTAMLQPGWLSRYLPPIAVGRVPQRWITASGYVWAALIVGTGVDNLVLILLLPARAAAAVMAAWAPASKIALFAGQYLLFRAAVRRHLLAGG